MEKFYHSKRLAKVPAQPRLVNHFMLGADPEFMFIANGKPVHAEALKLTAGLCVGADNNGRLVELRPKPSRFALKVLASVASELKWLALMYPKALDCEWKAGAYAGQDGLGGHVHFGRKRAALPLGPSCPYTDAHEVIALDHLEMLLESSEVFSKRECTLRRKESHGGHYGNLSDVRAQAHGWEYRTLPSWLNSPWLAYLSLVLSKLVVHDHSFGEMLPTVVNASQARRWIRNILARFKDLDDDARIAYLGLDVWGLPRATQNATDFKEAWGIFGLANPVNPPYQVPELLPPFIDPSQTDVEEMFRLIVYGKAISSFLPSPPTWPFQTLPMGYLALQKSTNTRVSPGLGELVWDGVTLHDPFSERDFRIWISCVHSIEKPFLAVDAVIARFVDFKELQSRFPGVRFSGRRVVDGGTLQFSKGLLTQKNLRTAREILHSGLLPVTRFNDLEKLNSWKERFKSAKPVKPSSRVLFQG